MTKGKTRSSGWIRRLAALAGGAALACAASGMSAAQEYPTRPIRVVVGFAAGGASDVVARILANKMSEILGVPMPVENRVGANSTIAMRHVAQADPDGYTLILAGSTAMAINPHTQPSLGYDPVKDFVGISTITRSSIVFAVNPSVKANTLKELVELAKSSGTLSMASSGTGGIAHMAIVMFQNVAKAPVTHIPYTGGAPAATDVVAGHVQSIAMDYTPLKSFIDQDKMRAIAVAGPERSSLLPAIPSSAEQGYPELVANNWYAFVAPARTPEPIVKKLHAALVQAAKTDDVKGKLAKIGSEVQTLNSPEEFPAFLKADLDRWGRVAKAAGIAK